MKADAIYGSFRGIQNVLYSAIRRDSITSLRSPTCTGNSTRSSGRTRSTRPTVSPDLMRFYKMVIDWTMQHECCIETKHESTKLIDKLRGRFVKKCPSKSSIPPTRCFDVPKSLDGQVTAMILNIAVNGDGKTWAWDVVYVVHSRKLLLCKIDKRSRIVAPVKVVGETHFVV